MIFSPMLNIIYKKNIYIYNNIRLIKMSIFDLPYFYQIEKRVIKIVLFINFFYINDTKIIF
jgi:hypothetical protein